MMSTELSGVIACRSISTTKPETIRPKFSHFKAWPEIEDWRIYYSLPTIGAMYRPDALPNIIINALNNQLPDWTPEEIIEEAIRWYPNPELFMSDMMPMLEVYSQMVSEYWQMYFGIELDKRQLQQTLANVLMSFGDNDASKSPASLETSKLLPAISKVEGKLNNTNDMSLLVAISNKMVSPEDTYSLFHEGGHLYSFKIIRPAITQYKTTWSAIEDLLQQVAMGADINFWNHFVDLNNKLKNCLASSLALEELRANLWALSLLPPDMQTTFITRIYGEKSENSSKKDREIFHILQSVAGGRPGTPLVLTLLAECLDPLDPVSQLEQLLNYLKVENAHTWSEEQWISWLQSWVGRDTWQIALNMIDDIADKSYSALPSAWVIGISAGDVITLCTETMRMPLFHESMRQQLFYRERIRTLTCPLKGRRRSCCGFGHFLRNFWTAIPNEERRRLRPPSRVCLNYAPIDSV